MFVLFGRIPHFGALLPKKPSLALNAKAPAWGATGGPLGGLAIALRRLSPLQPWMPIIALRSLSCHACLVTVAVMTVLVKSTVATWGFANVKLGLIAYGIDHAKFGGGSGFTGSGSASTSTRT